MAPTYALVTRMNLRPTISVGSARLVVNHQSPTQSIPSAETVNFSLADGIRGVLTVAKLLETIHVSIAKRRLCRLMIRYLVPPTWR